MVEKKNGFSHKKFTKLGRLKEELTNNNNIIYPLHGFFHLNREGSSEGHCRNPKTSRY
jgi:hypothetical protein